jgi:hypothetical protein
MSLSSTTAIRRNAVAEVRAGNLSLDAAIAAAKPMAVLMAMMPGAAKAQHRPCAKALVR